MLRKYLKNMAVNFRKNSFTYIMSIICLSAGLTIFSFVLSFCLFYYDYDRNIDQPENWYRLRTVVSRPDAPDMEYATFYQFIMKNLLYDIPEIEEYVVIHSDLELEIRSTDEDGNFIPISNSRFVSKNFPGHYNLQFLYGDPGPDEFVRGVLLVSRSFARKHFGRENVVGEKIFIRDVHHLLTVKGVFEDLPHNIHHRDESYRFIHEDNMYTEDEETQFWYRNHIRLKISDSSLVPVVQKKINTFLTQFNTDPNEIRSCIIEPITQIHFIQNLRENEKTTNINIIHTALFVSILLMITAFLNFFNLNSLLWYKRLSEYSFRKITGATRKDIARQLWVEFGAVYILAIALFLVLFIIFRNVVYTVLNLDISYYSLFHNSTTTLVIIAILLLGFLLSLIPITKIIHHKVVSNNDLPKKKLLGKNMILVLQVAISSFFIILSQIVYFQTMKVLNYDLGFSVENTLQYGYIASNQFESYTDTDVVFNELAAIPGIINVSCSAFNVAQGHKYSATETMMETLVTWKENGISKSIFAVLRPVSDNFINTMKVKVLLGDPSEIIHYDENLETSEVMVSKSLADYFFPDENPLGKIITSMDGIFRHKIVAVVADTHFRTLYQEPTPDIFTVTNEHSEFFQINYAPGQRDMVTEKANQVFDYFSKGQLLYYNMVDLEHELYNYYEDDRIFAKIIIFLALISAIIALTGIYAVSSLHIMGEMKQVSIRKICGATLFDLSRLFYKPYFYIVCSAWVISSFITFYSSSLFIQRYSVSIDFYWIFYIITLIVTIAAVFVPVYLNVIKAYYSNPSNYLNTE